MFAIRDDRYVLVVLVGSSLALLDMSTPVNTSSKKISRKLHARSAMPRNTRVRRSMPGVASSFSSQLSTRTFGFTARLEYSA
jgi:hypothetical protein